MLLQIVTVSTRPTRKGPAVAAWFEGQARAHGQFDIEPVDLAKVGLPLFDEPEHPRLRKYQHEHTRAWSATVDRADAFVFVTPEYNYGTPPSLVNACDYLLQEWAYKPAGFVSYGGASGGMRGVMMTRQLLMTLKVVPMVEAVAIPAFTKQIDQASGTFTAEPHQERAGKAMLDELYRWAAALQGLRGGPTQGRP